MRVFSFISVLLACSSLFAKAPVADRVLTTFDFEERKLGNSEDLPMYWEKIEGPAYPHYVNARFSTDRARSGRYSFRFDLNGGSLLYRYPAGRIKVTQGAHYHLEVMCRTTAMPVARARLSAYFTDIDGRKIENTVTHGEPYAAGAESEDWKKLSIEMSADNPSAASLVIELGLLQPSQYAKNTLGARTLHEQDIRGSAWFDDLVVAQVPRVTMTTGRAGNVFRLSDPLQVGVVVNDQFTDDLAVRLVIRDADRKEVFQRSGALDMKTAEKLPAGERRALLDLPELSPGWYEAALEMTSSGQMLGEQKMHMIRLADDAAPISPDQRIGIIATGLPFEGWSELPEILPILGAGRVKLALWSNDGDIQQTNSASFDVLLERLTERGISPTACLLGLPPSVSSRVNGSAWSQILLAKSQDWQPQLANLVSRHANHLDRWQIGEDGSESFVRDASMRRAYGRVYDEFSTLMQTPDLAMPWPAWYEMEGELPAAIALSVPPSVLPSQVPLYLGDLKSGNVDRRLSLSLQMLDREKYGRQVQICDFAQRLIYAISAGANRIDVPLPFTVSRDGDEVVKQPEEMLIVLRTLLTTLSGATYKGRVPLAEGIEAFLFDQNGKGILAVWTRGNDASSAKKIALNLGSRAASVDLWGNVTPLLRTPDDRGRGEVQVNIGMLPTFLVDIDGSQAQLRASVAIDRPLLESSLVPHQRKLRFTNPYRQAISGTIKLKAPTGWTLNPPTFAFSLNPDETFERDLTIQFPYNSYAGSKTLNVEFALQMDGPGNTFAVPLALNLGLSDVGMEAMALRDAEGVTVQQTITNYGDKPINYNVFSIFPGQARQERLVMNLAPGRTTMKKFRFSGVGSGPGKIRVGMKEMEGARVLNQEIEIQ